MPLYEYQCDACGCRFEVIQKFSDPVVETCKECGKGMVHRLFSSPAIQFKGTGWYITDYAQKGKSESSKETGAKTDAGKSDAAATESTSAKSESKTKTESKTEGAKSESGSAASTAKESKS